jgi:bifunctional lysine-specific demethylase and histidyl-hydroxylase MINA
MLVVKKGDLLMHASVAPNALPRQLSLWCFEDLVAPVKRSVFFKNYVDQLPFYGKDPHPNRFNSLMSWEILNELLSIPSLWTPQTLQLALEGKCLEPRFYCQTVASLNGPVQRPNPKQVIAYLEQGASLVCNELENLTPALRRMSRLLQEAFGAKIQANLYLSWKQKQAFKSHFDPHDVWAFHILGKKKWTVYQGRYDAPLPHLAFKQLGQAYHDQAKGEVAFQATLEPGDLLYLPRGTYHDAVAESEASLHVTFGVTRPIGLDMLSLFFEKAIHESFFRQNIPTDQLPTYLKQFSQACTSLLNSPPFQEFVSQSHTQFSPESQDYQLDKQSIVLKNP